MKGERIPPGLDRVEHLYGLNVEQMLAVRFKTISGFLDSIHPGSSGFLYNYGIKCNRFSEAVPNIPVSGVYSFESPKGVGGAVKFLDE